jgi:hypothetical protein
VHRRRDDINHGTALRRHGFVATPRSTPGTASAPRLALTAQLGTMTDVISTAVH